MAGVAASGNDAGVRRNYTKAERDELTWGVTRRRESVPEAAAKLGVSVSTAYGWVRAASAKLSATSTEKPGPRARAMEVPTFVQLVPATARDSSLVLRVGDVEITPGRNLATKALGYALNQEAELRRVLLDGNIPLDNTRAERALRKIVVGRKNWLFYGTDTHAEAAAAIFSIIATCRLHGIDPFVYFDEVLRVLPYWPRDRYLELAPQHWLATRAQLDPMELERPLSHTTLPSPTSASAESSTPAG